MLPQIFNTKALKVFYCLVCPEMPGDGMFSILAWMTQPHNETTYKSQNSHLMHVFIACILNPGMEFLTLRVFH